MNIHKMESVREKMMAYRILLVHILCMDFVTFIAASQWLCIFFLEPSYVPNKWTSNKQNIPPLLQRTYTLSSAYTVMAT